MWRWVTVKTHPDTYIFIHKVRRDSQPTLPVIANLASKAVLVTVKIQRSAN